MIKEYTITDFKPHYSLYQYFQDCGYELTKQTFKEATNICLWNLSINNKTDDYIQVKNQVEAKYFVGAKYGVPMTGWKAQKSVWASKDRKWMIGRKAGQKWNVYKADKGWLGVYFSSRQAAIDWINQKGENK